jgi:hypothetical protein
MFIACVVNPGRISHIVVLSAASFASPEYDVGVVMPNQLPPYDRLCGMFCGEECLARKVGWVKVLRGISRRYFVVRFTSTTEGYLKNSDQQPTTGYRRENSDYISQADLQVLRRGLSKWHCTKDGRGPRPLRVSRSAI